MKKMMRKVMTITTMVGMAISIFGGCGKNEASVPVHIAVVEGAVSNRPVINQKALESWMTETASITDSTVTLICADGAPYVAADFQIPALQGGLSGSKKRTLIQKRAEQLISTAVQVKAKTEQSNLLEAIDMGCRQLQTCSDEEQRTLLILDSGISSVEPLNICASGLEGFEAKDIVEQLEEASAIPDCSGLDIVFYNLGDTEKPQEALTSSQKKLLQEIWQGIFEAGQAAHITFAADLPSSAGYEDLPKVDTVSVVRNALDFTEEAAAEEEIPTSVIFDEEALTFEPGKAVLKDSSRAEKAISVIADFMKKDPDRQKAYVIGTTACWGDEKDALQLSYDRGQVLKKKITEYGVEEDRIIVIGTGWLSSYYKEDNKNGKLIDELAQKNRCCIWMQESSGDVQKILEDEDIGKFIVEK